VASRSRAAKATEGRRARQAGQNYPVDDDAELPALVRAALERGAVSGQRGRLARRRARPG
jgi:hypothetical protein